MTDEPSPFNSLDKERKEAEKAQRDRRRQAAESRNLAARLRAESAQTTISGAAFDSTGMEKKQGGGGGAGSPRVQVAGGRQDRRGSYAGPMRRGLNVSFRGAALRPGKSASYTGSRPNAIVKSAFVPAGRDAARQLGKLISYCINNKQRDQDKDKDKERDKDKEDKDNDKDRSEETDQDRHERLKQERAERRLPDKQWAELHTPTIEEHADQKEPRGSFFTRHKSGVEPEQVYQDIMSKAGEEKAFHKVILSFGDNEVHVHDMVRDAMTALEKELGYTITWYASAHFDTRFNHAHIIIAGRDISGRHDVVINKENHYNWRQSINDRLARERGFSREYDRWVARELGLDSPSHVDRDAEKMLWLDKYDPAKEVPLPVRQRLEDEKALKEIGLFGTFDPDRDPVMQESEKARVRDAVNRIESNWESEQQLSRDAYQLGQGLSINDLSSASGTNPHNLNDDKHRDDDEQSRFGRK